MIKLKKVFIVLLSVFTISACAFAGCASSDSSGEHSGGALRNEGQIISYISSQTEVYSSTAEVVEAIADSVVEISTESIVTQWGKQYIVSGAGSGVIVGKQESVYYIITNNHVIDGAKEINVTTRSGVSYKAELVATDDSADIAVVKVNSDDELLVAVWGNSDELKIGEDLIAIGNPLGSLGGTVTKGILSAKGRSITVGDYTMTLLQTDTAINPGNSGGGLFNMRGELIGVVNAKTSDEEIEGICFAIPSNHAISVYNDLVNYGYITGRATFNLTLSSSGGNSGSNIVYVTAVSGAEEGTFMQYDRIYKINGKEITSILDYNNALSEISPGDSVEVEVYRGTVTQWTIRFESTVTKFTVTASQYGA